jgi:NAD(P)H-hydrate epimerase
MAPALTRDQTREVDRLAVEELGIPSIVLMENAARQTAEVVLDILETDLHLITVDAKVVVFCGGGNNGGDGYATARHLANRGVQVAALACSDPDSLDGDAAVNCDIASRMQLVVEAADLPGLDGALAEAGEPHVVVDALLGTGFQGEVREPLDAMIERINVLREGGAKVVAVDVPSGLDCETGQPSNATVEADVTVTFVAAKAGYGHDQAPRYVGEVVVADIGAPESLIGHVLTR